MLTTCTSPQGTITAQFAKKCTKKQTKGNDVRDQMFRLHDRDEIRGLCMLSHTF